MLSIWGSSPDLTFFHAFTDVPVHESALGVHEVKLVVQGGPRVYDSTGVAERAHGSGHARQVPARHHGGRLVVDSHLQVRMRRARAIPYQHKTHSFVTLMTVGRHESVTTPEVIVTSFAKFLTRI